MSFSKIENSSPSLVLFLFLHFFFINNFWTLLLIFCWLNQVVVIESVQKGKLYYPILLLFLQSLALIFFMPLNVSCVHQLCLFHFEWASNFLVFLIELSSRFFDVLKVSTMVSYLFDIKSWDFCRVSHLSFIKPILAFSICISLISCLILSIKNSSFHILWNSSARK